MGFAAGFSAGYGAVTSGFNAGVNLVKVANDKKAADAKLKAAEADLKRQSTKDHNDFAKNLGTISKLVEEGYGKTIAAENHDDYEKAVGEMNAGYAQIETIMNNPELTGVMRNMVDNVYSSLPRQESLVQMEIEDTKGNKLKKYVPRSFEESSGSMVLMENGELGIRQLESDGAFSKDVTPTGYKPTEFKAKADAAGDGTVKVVDNTTGEVVWMSKAEAVDKTKDSRYSAYENLTGMEASIDQITRTSDFKSEYGHLPKNEQLRIARNVHYDNEIASNPAFRDKFVSKVTNEFSAKVETGVDRNTILSEYDTLDTAQKGALKTGQMATAYGKEHIKNHSGEARNVMHMRDKAQEVMEMTEEDVDRGFGWNQLNNLMNALPTDVSEWTDTDMNKLMAHVRADATLKDIFFTYLNEVNKGAPSNADMAVMREVVMSGAQGNLSATKEALGMFMNRVMIKTKGYYEDNAPYIMSLARKDYDHLDKLTPFDVPSESMSAPTEKIAPKAADFF